MANNIERLNYYEREYLRSFDFIAEQNYHMEMRRRLNLALHLWGIVDGLDVRKGSLVPGAPDQFFITEGMAIDAYGREIILFAPYLLSEDDLTNNRIGQPGRYSLWIAYVRNQTTPPSPGYGLCDLAGQYTRWRESAKVVIKEESFANGTEPRVFDALSDDPQAAAWFVRLGTIDTDLVSGQLTIVDARPEQRIYIGLRAQRVLASVASLLPPSTDAALPISIENDVLEKKNLIVGADFAVDGNKVQPKPADPAKFPGPTGNVKAANVFLRDNLYLNVAPNWLGLKEYVKTIIPDIQVGSKALTITPGADPSSDTEKITLTSTLPTVQNPKLIASIAQIDRLTGIQYISWLANINPNSPFLLDVAVEAPIQKTANTYDFPIRWTIGPTANPGTATAMLNVTGLTVSYIAIFYPL